MRRIVCEHALIHGEWRRHVVIEVAADGSIANLAPAARGEEGERLAGYVVPGLVDVHVRVTDRLLAGFASRGRGSERALCLRRRLLALIGPEELWAAAASTFVALLHAGCTAAVAFHELHHAPDGTPYEDPALLALVLHEAAREVGIGLTLVLAGQVSGGFDGRPVEGPERRSRLSPEALARLGARLAREFRDDPERRLAIGIAVPGGVPPSRLAEFFAVGDSLGPRTPVHVPLAMGPEDVARCRACTGDGPLSTLRRIREPDAAFCLLGAARLEPAERQALSRLEAVAGLLPEAEMRSAPALAELLYRLPTLAVGSGPGGTLDPTALLRWLLLAKVAAGGGAEVAPGPVLLRTLAGSAQASGRAVGRIAPGFRADLVHLDPTHPLLAGLAPEDVLAAWITVGERRSWVRDVMVGGRWQIRDGRHAADERVETSFRRVRERLFSSFGP